MNRLVAEKSTSDVTSLNYSNNYVYDLNGNRLQKISKAGGLTETINYSYNANDLLKSETSSAKGNISYSYNASGSLTTKNGQGESCRYTYNLQNRLATAKISRTENGKTVKVAASYVYDTAGIRVKAANKQTIAGVASTNNRFFLTEAGFTGYSQILEESATLGGKPVKSYVLGDDVISQTVNGTVSHLLYDGHGSTRLLTDKNGAISDLYDFDAYGVMLGGNPNITSPAATDLLYSGEQFDRTLQQQYLRARYYDQNCGRFNRLDPYAGNHSDPQSLHKYAYCHSDPVNNIDPTGKCLGAAGGIGAISIGLGVLSALSTFTYLKVVHKVDFFTAASYAVLTGILTALSIYYAPVILTALAAASPFIQAGYAIMALYFLIMGAYAMADAFSVAFSSEYSFKERTAAVFYIAFQLTIWLAGASFVRGKLPMSRAATSNNEGGLSSGPSLIVSVPKGKTFKQVVSPGQPKPGAYAVLKNVKLATQNVARNKLGLLRAFKLKIAGTQKIKVEGPNVKAAVEIIGPQRHYSGGGIQLRFIGANKKSSSVGLIFVEPEYITPMPRR